jgi:two-component system cell cycle response regulator
VAHILVIEDNPANLELMVYLLRAFGHEPVEALSGEQGLDLIRAQRPDLILCDLQLPGIDGFQVARRLRGDPGLGGIPLVAVTAQAMVGDRDRVLAEGFDGYITKPILPESFPGQIAPYLPEDSPSQEPAAHPTVPGASPVPSQGASVLLVDDVPTNLGLLRSILEPSGYRVRTAQGVREALALARLEPPDLIVSDVVMPEATGLDLVAEVRGDPSLSRIPVVLHSATSGSGRNRARALALGASGFLVRPIEPRLFLAEVEELIRHAHGDGSGSSHRRARA